MAATAENGRKQEWLVPRRPPVEAYELLSPVQQRRVDGYPDGQRAAAAWLLLIDSGPEWRTRATPCRNCAGQRWPCVDPATPGQRRRCEGCFRSGWVCNDPTPLWTLPATPQASTSTPRAPAGRAQSQSAPATPVFRPSTATTVLDLTSTSGPGRRQRRASPDDTEDNEEIVDIDDEAELFFASQRSAESADSDDEIEFIGMSEAPGFSQPPKKRPRHASPPSNHPAADDAGPSIIRETPLPALVVSRSTNFTVDTVHAILKAAERTAPSDVAVSWPGRPQPAPGVAHSVMVHKCGKTFNIALWDHSRRTVNYIYETGFNIPETLVSDVLAEGRARRLYNVQVGVTWMACPARNRPHTTSSGMWASVMAVWLTRNHGVQECLELLEQFTIRPAHVCEDLNAILRGEHWLGQCFELQGRPRNARTAAGTPNSSVHAQDQRPAQVTDIARAGSEKTVGSPSTLPVDSQREPPSVLSPPSQIPDITSTTEFTPDLVKEILASARKTAPQSQAIAFNNEIMGFDKTNSLVLVSNVGSSWSIAVCRPLVGDVHYIYVPGASHTGEDHSNIKRVLSQSGIAQQCSNWVNVPCPHLKGVAGGLWVSVMAVWLTSNKKLGKHLKAVSRFVVRQKGFASYLNAVLRGKRESGTGYNHVNSQVKQEANMSSDAGGNAFTATQPEHNNTPVDESLPVKPEPLPAVESGPSTQSSRLRSPSSIFEYKPPPLRR
ncbi:hypothetical protein A1Q2_01261 [Trichosporon asahii var. asahii CBS 8904]|uniref:Uncharacterized protein n=1 Tax=Trichosporon asahii var. asahii (strain CBS 8904) TaxID=1220162 RepID=K1VJZ7_TRIAC|nr:hypothetical protein A1Q2_01261 [Trichosporon asahii var. asahii CBS 8904]